MPRPGLSAYERRRGAVTTEDKTMKRIEEAMMLQHTGDLDGARQRFTEIWEEIASDGDPFHRCVLAHYMADLQQDPQEELAWDLRALDAAASVTDDRAKQHDSRDYERHPHRSEAMIHLAMIDLMVRRLTSEATPNWRGT